MKLSSIVKGAGAGATVLAGSWWSRALLAGTSYRVSKQLDPVGLEVVSITVQDEVPSQPWERPLAEVVGIGSWTVASLGVAAALDRAPLPRVVRAAAYGAAVALADDVMGRKLMEIQVKAKGNDAAAAGSGASDAGAAAAAASD